MSQFGFVRVQNHPPGGFFQCFIPCFGARFCITNPTHIFHNKFITKWLRIFQLGSFGKNALLHKGIEPPSTSSLLPTAYHTYLHTPVLPQCFQTSKRTLEALEGLEAFYCGALGAECSIGCTRRRDVVFTATFGSFSCRKLWEPTARCLKGAESSRRRLGFSLAAIAPVTSESLTRAFAAPLRLQCENGRYTMTVATKSHAVM